jgi:hypothetical protein
VYNRKLQKSFARSHTAAVSAHKREFGVPQLPGLGHPLQGNVNPTPPCLRDERPSASSPWANVVTPT